MVGRRVLVAIPLALSLLVPPATAATGPAMPTARGAIGVAAIGDQIYALGGADSYGGSNVKQVLEVFSVAAGGWTQGAPLPDTNAWGPGTVGVGGSLYAVGGWPSGGALSRRYDPGTNQWTSLAAAPGYMWGHAVVSVGNSIYAMGGSTMHRYDVGTDTWTPLAAPLYTSAGMGAVTDGSDIYLVLSSGYLQIYDIASNVWTEGVAAPAGFDGPSAALAVGKMFVFGGQSATEEDVVYGYELATGRWSRYAAGGQLWSWTGAATASDGIHVLGGFTPTGPTTDHLVFDPSSPPLPDDPRCQDDPNANCGTDDDDDLVGTPGADVIFGGLGDDTIESGDGDDEVSGDAGDDTLDTGAGNDTANGGTGHDRVFAGAGSDLAKGGAGNDLLEMAEGLDRVFGGGGRDEIDGGAGFDEIDGGKGFDICYFSSRKEKKRMKNCEDKRKRAH